jgi:uncharacterized protein DUF2278
MPLPAYGVLIGTLVRFARENPNNFGSWYHGKLYIAAPAGQYEGAVDVSTPSGIKVQYRFVDALDSALFQPISSLPNGWHLLATTPTSGALDYVRSPLLRGPSGCVAAILAIFGVRTDNWVDSTGDNALDQLEGLLKYASRVFVFGAPYTSGLGVHDIHMNQGDPPGPFQVLDGIWQDGGTLMQLTDGRFVAFLTKFETQTLNTNTQGLPV